MRFNAPNGVTVARGRELCGHIEIKGFLTTAIGVACSQLRVRKRSTMRISPRRPSPFATLLYPGAIAGAERGSATSLASPRYSGGALPCFITVSQERRRAKLPSPPSNAVLQHRQDVIKMRGDGFAASTLLDKPSAVLRPGSADACSRALGPDALLRIGPSTAGASK